MKKVYLVYSKGANMTDVYRVREVLRTRIAALNGFYSVFGPDTGKPERGQALGRLFAAVDDGLRMLV